jgi:hypothetical protein
MNLAWIAAVLRPHVIVPPSSGDLDYSSIPTAQLAAIVEGGFGWRMRRGPSIANIPPVPEIEESLQNVERSMDRRTINEGINGLKEELIDRPTGDLARSCALSLLVCSAAAEMDDYVTCETVLDHLLRLADDTAQDSRLTRAILLQQRSLRARDSGTSYVDFSIEAANLLEGIDVAACQEFQLSPRASEPYTETLTHIVEAVRDAALSFIPPSVLTPKFRPSRPDQLLRIDRSRASEYADFVTTSYKTLFRTGDTMTIGGSPTPDLFRPALALELLGHREVYNARKELAQLRLIQGATEESRDDLGDALRLLRQAGADRDLDWAVDWLRATGPLAALSEDARRILRQRLLPRMLRVVELRVLRAAAEILTPTESRLALDAVLDGVASDGPPDSPGHQQSLMLKKEAAWRTAAALANSAGQPGRVADFLLDVIARSNHNDELDHAMGRALWALDWTEFDAATTARWSDWLRHPSTSMRRTRDVVGTLLQIVPQGAGETRSKIDEIVARLNSSQKEALSPEILEAAKAEIREHLARIRTEAAQGSYSGGGINPADVAAALICRGAADDLWADVAALLTDTAVQRDDRSAAFDRLARQLPPIPSEIAQLFRNDAMQILFAPQIVFLSGDETIPYAAALRFLARYNLIDEAQIFAFVAQLAGSSSPRSREQAARTVAALVVERNDIWLQGVATQLSHDRTVEVKAHAGRALAMLASAHQELAVVASDRLVELLREDGMLVPLLVMRELDRDRTLPESIRQEIARLETDHPSRLVRKEAAQILAVQR